VPAFRVRFEIERADDGGGGGHASRSNLSCGERIRDETGKRKTGFIGIRGIAIRPMTLPNTFRRRIGK
jgi:hypothetical protein